MKIIICGSISAAKEMILVEKELINRGFIVTIPKMPNDLDILERSKVNISERVVDKIKFDLIRSYYEKIKQSDIVLIVNPEKNGIKGYIGGNTLIEMAFAHVLDKKLYCLYEIPNMTYSSEILAMQPIVLNGNLENIQ